MQECWKREFGIKLMILLEYYSNGERACNSCVEILTNLKTFAH